MESAKDVFCPDLGSLALRASGTLRTAAGSWVGLGVPRPTVAEAALHFQGFAPLNGSGLHQITRPDREATEAFPSGGEDSVGHSGSNRRNAGFADTAGPLVVVDDMHFGYERGFVHAQDFVVVEI